MSDTETNQLDPLYALRKSLEHAIHAAQVEAKHSNEQLESLVCTKSLLDNTINVFGSGIHPHYDQIAATTILPTGSMAIPMCNDFIASQPGPNRRLISHNIQYAMESSISAFVTDSWSDPSPELEHLRAQLESRQETLVSLEERLCARLEKYDEHLEVMLRGSLQSFRDFGNPLRCSNAGNSLRELYREFLDGFATDAVVKQAPWFVPDKTSRNGVTRRHRIEYAIFGNLAKDQFPNEFVTQANGIADNILKQIGRLSSYTHVTEEVLSRESAEAAALFASVLQHFLLLISAIETSRNLVGDELSVRLQPGLDNVFISDFFDELDCLSSHTRIDGVYNIEIDEVSFDESLIYISGSGTVTCDLQYGSDGDVRRGDGVEWSDSFPFNFKGCVQIADTSNIEIDRSSIKIDTSSYYDDEPLFDVDTKPVDNDE